MKAQEKAKAIKLVVFDVDGVMTDGRLFFTNDGNELKAFNVKDGLGIKMLHQCGIQTAIITGRTSTLVEHRAKNLGITFLYQGREDKLIALNELLSNIGLKLDEVAYMGDDLPDLAAIQEAGLGTTVADALPLVKKHADWITQKSGGDGAVRELCEFILEQQGALEGIQANYLSTASTQGNPA